MNYCKFAVNILKVHSDVTPGWRSHNTHTPFPRHSTPDHSPPLPNYCPCCHALLRSAPWEEGYRKCLCCCSVYYGIGRICEGVWGVRASWEAPGASVYVKDSGLSCKDSRSCAPRNCDCETNGLTVCHQGRLGAASGLAVPF